MTASTRRPVAVGLALALATVMLGTASPAFAAATWYVATTGNDSADCLTPATPCASIGGVLTKPSFVANDVIRIATGTQRRRTQKTEALEPDLPDSVRGGDFFARHARSQLTSETNRACSLCGGTARVSRPPHPAATPTKIAKTHECAAARRI